MSEFNLLKCPQFLDNAITPPAKEIGTTLGNIFYAIFSPINYNVEKLKIKQSENLKKYQSDIESELSKIPEDKLTEPQLSIIGPALEASKYYIEENELRKMFAKLIAASMNVDTKNTVHPSFVEIIKQFSPLDAQVLSIFKSWHIRPIVTYKLVNNNSTFDIVFSDAFVCTEINAPLINLSTSISNLNRFKMVDISYSTDFKKQSVYDKFLHTDFFNTFKNIIENKTFKDNKDFLDKYAKGCIIHDIVDISFDKGYVKLTNLGKQFIDVCL
ncbi:DUF4393 domain-containing protein [Clostridium butyricum]|uniref:DUF4393 domain-containing protein n=1 Tax=Clostridium butyricum TaxID=1492 RepID=UPI00374E29FD